MLSAEGVRDEVMKLLLLGNNLLTIEGHSRPMPRDLGAGQIPAEDGDMGNHTTGAKELMVALEGPRDTLASINFALPMALCQLVEELLSRVLRSLIALAEVGHMLCPVYPLGKVEGVEPRAQEGIAFVGDEFTRGSKHNKRIAVEQLGSFLASQSPL